MPHVHMYVHQYCTIPIIKLYNMFVNTYVVGQVAGHDTCNTNHVSSPSHNINPLPTENTRNIIMPVQLFPRFCLPQNASIIKTSWQITCTSTRCVSHHNTLLQRCSLIEFLVTIRSPQPPSAEATKTLFLQANEVIHKNI